MKEPFCFLTSHSHISVTRDGEDADSRGEHRRRVQSLPGGEHLAAADKAADGAKLTPLN